MSAEADLAKLSATCLEVLEPPERDIDQRSIKYRMFGDSLFLVVENRALQQQLVELIKFFRSMLARSIRVGLPIRGAISYGPVRWEKTLILGSALVEAVETAERQEWIGVVAAPSVSALVPDLPTAVRGHLARYEVPVKPKDLWLGWAVKPSGDWALELLPALDRMLLASSSVDVQRKYENTMKFLHTVR
jgi:hypothetical protein